MFGNGGPRGTFCGPTCSRAGGWDSCGGGSWSLSAPGYATGSRHGSCEDAAASSSPPAPASRTAGLPGRLGTSPFVLDPLFGLIRGRNGMPCGSRALCRPWPAWAQAARPFRAVDRAAAQAAGPTSRRSWRDIGCPAYTADAAPRARLTARRGGEWMPRHRTTRRTRPRRASASAPGTSPAELSGRRQLLVEFHFAEYG